MTMHVFHFERDDFAAILLQAEVLNTHTGPSGTRTHTATYLNRDVILIEQPNAAGGTVIEPASQGEVGAHEVARDALTRGLIDPPMQES